MGGWVGGWVSGWGKGRLQLVWSQKVENKSMAAKYEYYIKKLTKVSKEALVNNESELPEL